MHVWNTADRTSAMSGDEQEFGLTLMRCCMPVVLWKTELVFVILRVEGWQTYPRPPRRLTFLASEGSLHDALVEVEPVKKKREEDESGYAEYQVASSSIAEAERSINIVCLDRIPAEVPKVYREESHGETRQRRDLASA